MASDTRSLTDGPVWRALAVMSAPMSLGILAVLSVGIADAIFLARYSDAALAAVGFIYPVTTAITSLSIGLSAGANAAISQGIGAGDNAECRRALHAAGLGTALAVLAALAVWLAYPYLFAALGAQDAPMEAVRAYMPVWALSFPFLVLMMLLNAVFRAHGHGGLSAVIMVAAAVVNIALDPLLIFGLWVFPELGAAGAAWATLIGRVLAMGTALWIALQRGYIAVGKTPMKNLGQSARELARVGAPAAFSNAINPAGMAAVTAAVATVGAEAVAGFGAATRVQAIVIVPMLALSAGIGPVVGQNWGAEEWARAKRSLTWALGICLSYGLLVGALLLLLARPIAGLLTGGGAGTDQAALYLRFVGLSLFGYGFVVVANAAMNARSKAQWSMGLSLARIFAVYLPGAWLGVWVLGYSGILIAAVAANLLGALGALFAAYKTGLLETSIPPSAGSDAPRTKRRAQPAE
ncbi:MAG: MATE family efflux transporter [Shimia sp.]